MPIFLSYALVVVIWSTTPLAVYLSNDSLSSITAVNARMLLAFVLAAVLTCAWLRKSFDIKRYWKIYAAASIGIFPNMPLVYASAKYINSSMIAVIFALSPFMIALILLVFSRNNKPKLQEVICLCIAISGLLIVSAAQISMKTEAWIGIALMLGSVVCFSVSNLLIKYCSENLDKKPNPFNQLTGSLLFSIPGLLISWVYMDGEAPSFSSTSLMATFYLAIVGSVLGFAAYFFLLNNISALSVSIIPMITPAFALMLGNIFNQEVISLQVILGTGLIIVALAFFNPDLVKACRDWLLGKPTVSKKL